MTLQTKRELILELLKVSALMESFDPGNKLTFIMPGLPPSQAGEETITICRNMIVNLLNIGRKLFEKAQGMVDV